MLSPLPSHCNSLDDGPLLKLLRQLTTEELLVLVSEADKSLLRRLEIACCTPDHNCNCARRRKKCVHAEMKALCPVEGCVEGLILERLYPRKYGSPRKKPPVSPAYHPNSLTKEKRRRFKNGEDLWNEDDVIQTLNRPRVIAAAINLGMAVQRDDNHVVKVIELRDTKR